LVGSRAIDPSFFKFVPHCPSSAAFGVTGCG
jgi:hypothetical protein